MKVRTNIANQNEKENKNTSWPARPSRGSHQTHSMVGLASRDPLQNPFSNASKLVFGFKTKT